MDEYDDPRAARGSRRRSGGLSLEAAAGLGADSRRLPGADRRDQTVERGARGCARPRDSSLRFAGLVDRCRRNRCDVAEVTWGW